MKLRNLTFEQSGFLKGVLSTSLVFTACAGIGLYFLHQRHEDELDELEKDTSKFCLHWAVEHYERVIQRKYKPEEEASCNDRKTARGYSAMTGREATPEEWEALEKRMEQSRAEYERLVEEVAEKNAECQTELDKLRAQIYADNDRLNEARNVDSCKHENL